MTHSILAGSINQLLRVVPNTQSTKTGLKRTELAEQGDAGVQQLGVGTD